jgi:tRNA-modifying protein YgfZ
MLLRSRATPMTSRPFERQVLANRALFSVEGEDALRFLDALVTADLAALDTEQAAYGALLTPQGKILHDFFALRTVDGFLIDCAFSQRLDFVQRLATYKLRAKVSVAPRDELEAGAMPDDGSLPLAYPDPRLATMGCRMIAPKGTLPHGGGYDAWRIGQGIADSEADIGVGKLFPHEANLDKLGGVSFTKGCFVGQEVVSRMEHRATTRSRIVPVTYQGTAPPPGAVIMSGGHSIGIALSSSAATGLALMRLDRLREAAQALAVNGVGVEAKLPFWLAMAAEEAGLT